MKICWDNLEKYDIYLSKNGNFRSWKNRTTTYKYGESCGGCGEPFLYQAISKGIYCNNKCQSKNPEERKKQIKTLKNWHKENPEARSIFMKKWYEKNPEIKEKLSKIAKKQWENPEERKEMSKIKKKYYEENPETAQIHSERMKKYSENPKVKEIFGKRMKKWYEENQHHGWKGGGEYAPFDTYAEQLDYAEDVRNNDNKLEVRCAYCGKWYIPKVGSVQHRITALNNKGYGEARLYCSEGCKISCPVYNQHLWPKGFKIGTSREVQPELRQMVLARDNYICQKCGVTESLHCHHKEGIRWEPIESADIDMCITFCKDCHKEVHKIEGCGYYEMRCVNE